MNYPNGPYVIDNVVGVPVVHPQNDNHSCDVAQIDEGVDTQLTLQISEKRRA